MGGAILRVADLPGARHGSSSPEELHGGPAEPQQRTRMTTSMNAAMAVFSTERFLLGEPGQVPAKTAMPRIEINDAPEARGARLRR